MLDNAWMSVCEVCVCVLANVCVCVFLRGAYNIGMKIDTPFHLLCS